MAQEEGGIGITPPDFKKMNICLVSPFEGDNAIGIRILSSCLKQRGHNTQIVFLPNCVDALFNGTAFDELLHVLKSSGLIGISVQAHVFDKAARLTQALKEKTCIPIIWGGIHATTVPMECLEHADMVCIGEGELALVELADKMGAGEDFSSIQNIWFKDNGRITKNKLRPLIDNLDSIPFPDYDCENHYIQLDDEIKRLTKKTTPIWSWHGKLVYVVLPSRGCPFGCTYCCNNVLNRLYAGQKVFRKRSPGNIIKELIYVTKLLPQIEFFVFEDDAFFLYTVEEVKEFSAEYKRAVNMPFRIGGATPLTITEEKLAYLVDAGLQGIRIGIQTGSSRIKGLYKRSYNNDQVVHSASIIDNFRGKIKMPEWDIIVDNPWEREEDFVETLKLLTKLPVPFELRIFSLNFYPGTELFDMAIKDGIVFEEATQKSYFQCKPTYFNQLFRLVADRSISSQKISADIIFLLTDKWMRRMKINLVVLFFLSQTSKVSYYLKHNSKIPEMLKCKWVKILNKWCNNKQKSYKK